MNPDDIGKHIHRVRLQAGLGLRELGRMAGMSPAALSAIEKGKTSPTLATLNKLLRALGTDFVSFFSASSKQEFEPVFRKSDQRAVADAHREYVFVLPPHEEMKCEMLLETITPAEKDPEWEVHDCDVGGHVLTGGPIRLQIKGVGEWTLNKGDAFYIKSGQKHRAENLSDRPVKLITVICPPRY